MAVEVCYSFPRHAAHIEFDESAGRNKVIYIIEVLTSNVFPMELTVGSTER